MIIKKGPLSNLYNSIKNKTMNLWAGGAIWCFVLRIHKGKLTPNTRNKANKQTKDGRTTSQKETLIIVDKTSRALKKIQQSSLHL